MKNHYSHSTTFCYRTLADRQTDRRHYYTNSQSF